MRGMPFRVRARSALQSYGSGLDWIDRRAIAIMHRSTDSLGAPLSLLIASVAPSEPSGGADAHAAGRRREDRGVDTDHLALGVEGRAAGIALIHGGVDLQEVVVGARVRPTGRPCAESSRLDDFGPDEQTFSRPVAPRRGNPCVDRGPKFSALVRIEAAQIVGDRREAVERVSRYLACLRRVLDRLVSRSITSTAPMTRILPPLPGSKNPSPSRKGISV